MAWMGCNGKNAILIAGLLRPPWLFSRGTPSVPAGHLMKTKYDRALKTGSAVPANPRRGALTRPTTGLSPWFVQAKLLIVPPDLAFYFLFFFHRHPKPFPL